MKRIAALVFCTSILMAQGAGPVRHYFVTAVRHWSLDGVTRVVIQVSGDFKFRGDRLHNPERIYYDILYARPHIHAHRFYTENVNDKLLHRIRVAETEPDITRIVLDVADGAEAVPSQLTNPNRLIVELRLGHPAAPTPPPATNTPTTPTTPTAPLPSPPALSTPIPTAVAPLMTAKLTPPAAVPTRPQPQPVSKPLAPAALSPAPAPSPTPAPVTSAATPPPGPGKAARHTSRGQESLIRALGLKIQRVVIDPGHGGHDQGTSGPKGLLEKDVVLDISKRLGALIEQRMGSEVIYTRTDDTFIPLEARTALANDKHADLFLSIHANSSPYPRITGIETFYLNFTDSKADLDVAARENASSQKSIFELRDIIQKITQHDKAEESREFASRVQTALYAFSAHTLPGSRNRGVKKAPFVVLIGANMPSVLAEIGFLSNPREEALLRKSDYRQKLAEALYRGVSKYADSLSHFQVAEKTVEKKTP